MRQTKYAGAHAVGAEVDGEVAGEMAVQIDGEAPSKTLRRKERKKQKNCDRRRARIKYAEQKWVVDFIEQVFGVVLGEAGKDAMREVLPQRKTNEVAAEDFL